MKKFKSPLEVDKVATIKKDFRSSSDIKLLTTKDIPYLENLIAVVKICEDVTTEQLRDLGVFRLGFVKMTAESYGLDYYDVEEVRYLGSKKLQAVLDNLKNPQIESK